MIDEERPDAPEEEGADQGATEQPEAEAEAPTEEQAPAEEPATEEQPATEEPPPAEEEPATEEPPPAQEEPAAAEQSAGDEDLSSVEDETEEVGEAPEAAQEERPKRGDRDRKEGAKEEVIPGAHLAPDLVLEEERPEGEFGEYGDAAGYEAPATAEGEPTAGEGEPEAPGEHAAPRSVLDLAADAFYQATGKRKSSVARVILRPGDGAYSVNGRSLEDYFPRAALQKAARQPLATAGFEKRMDVVARIHGGGISAQAGALRHGVARALVEADPSLRVELKRRGFLSRDARMKERKKAGLKKARKRPQFSKR